MSLEKSVQRATNLARDVNAFTDVLNHELTVIESALERAGVGVYVWLDEPIGETSEPWDSFRLGWGKGQHGWGFYITSDTTNPVAGLPRPGHDETHSLLNGAWRSARIAAFPKIQALVDLIGDRLQDAMDDYEPLKDSLAKKAAEWRKSQEEGERAEIPF